MKKYLLPCLLSGTSLLALQAVADNPPASKPKLTAEGRTIIEKGQKIPQIDSVNVMGVGTLIINQSGDQSLELEAEDKILPLVEVSIKDNALFIQLKEAAVEEGTKVKYQLSIKDVKVINTFGTTAVNIPKVLNTKNLTMNIKGSGDSNLKLSVDKFTASINGGAKVTVSGNAIDQTIEINGAGIFYGEQLAGKNMKVSINGAGLARTHSSEKLDINISGVGEVKYCEKPVITKDIKGSGEVTPLPANDCEIK